MVIVPYKRREIRLQNFTQWKMLLQNNTQHYIRTLQAGRINHMYSSQNSLILCFIILILNGS